MQLEKELKVELKKEGIFTGRVTKVQEAMATNFAVYATQSTQDTSEEQRMAALKAYKQNTGKLPSNETQLADAVGLLSGIAPTKGISKTVARRIEANVKAVCKKQRARDECKEFESITKGVVVEVNEEQLEEGKKIFQSYFNVKPNMRDFIHQRMVNGFAATNIEEVAPPPPPKKPARR